MPHSTHDPAETVFIVNPTSGTADHEEDIRRRAAESGYRVRTSEGAGDVVSLTAESIAAGATTVVAVGGDGTVNEVVRGVCEADALGRVAVGVVPTGTGNGFARHIGITDIDTAFALVADGERRWLDVGVANGSPFVNSCIAGLTAEASARTSPEQKARLGVLAYVITTVRLLPGFEGLDLTATVKEGNTSETVWDATAAMVLIGNARGFSVTGGRQADLEDGLLDVTIIEDATTLDLVGDGTRRRLFDDAGEHITRLFASTMEISAAGDRPITFSLDGEMETFTSVEFSVQERALRMPVGEDYVPHPRDAR